MFGCAIQTPWKQVLINEISLWLRLFALFRAKKYGDQNKYNNEKKNTNIHNKIGTLLTLISSTQSPAELRWNHLRQLMRLFILICVDIFSFVWNWSRQKNLDDDWNNLVQFELKMGVCGNNKRDIYIQIVCTVCHQSSYSESFINLHAIIR